MAKQSGFDIVEGDISLHKSIVLQKYHCRRDEVGGSSKLLQGYIRAFIELGLVKLDKERLGNIIGNVGWQGLRIGPVNYFARHNGRLSGR